MHRSFVRDTSPGFLSESATTSRCPCGSISAAAPRKRGEVQALEFIQVSRNQRGRQTRSAPSPLVGEGWGGGWRDRARHRHVVARPPPPTPPHKGEGSPPSAWRRCATTSPD